MRRREMLAVVASAVSGCIDFTDGLTVRETPRISSGSTTPRTVPERTTSQPSGTVTPPTSPFPRRVAVETADDEPLREAFGVAIEVTVTDSDVTPGDTAQVELGLDSVTGTQRSLTYEQRHCGRNEFRGTTDDFALFLFPAEGDWTVEGADCPVVSHPNLSCGIPVVEKTVTVPASGRLAWRYDVLVPPGNIERGGCVVPGQYRFTRSFTGETATATLAFTLSITEP